MLIDTKEYPMQLHLDYFGLFGTRKFHYNLGTRIFVKPIKALWTSSVIANRGKVTTDWIENGVREKSIFKELQETNQFKLN